MKIQAPVTKSFKPFATKYGTGLFFEIQYKEKKVNCVTYNSQLANSIQQGSIIHFEWWEPHNVKNKDETWKTVMLISAGAVSFVNGVVIETPNTPEGEEKLQQIEESEELNFDWEKDLL